MSGFKRLVTASMLAASVNAGAAPSLASDYESNYRQHPEETVWQDTRFQDAMNRVLDAVESNQRPSDDVMKAVIARSRDVISNIQHKEAKPGQLVSIANNANNLAVVVDPSRQTLAIMRIRLNEKGGTVVTDEKPMVVYSAVDKSITEAAIALSAKAAIEPETHASRATNSRGGNSLRR